MVWYVVFGSRKSVVYDLWGVCSEYVVDFSGAALQSYSIRMQAEKAYVTFVEHQNKL
jgi:viroplasmin and RNaseH domain-containing protein